MTPLASLSRHSATTATSTTSRSSSTSMLTTLSIILVFLSTIIPQASAQGAPTDSSCRFFPDGTFSRLSVTAAVFSNCEAACLRDNPSNVYAGFNERQLACYCSTAAQFAASQPQEEDLCDQCGFGSIFSGECNFEGGVLLQNVRQLSGRAATTTTSRTTTAVTTTTSAVVTSRTSPTLTSPGGVTLPPVSNAPGTTQTSISGSSNNGASENASASSALSTGAIAAIVIAVILVAIILIAVFIILQRKRRSNSNNNSSPSWAPTSNDPKSHPAPSFKVTSTPKSLTPTVSPFPSSEPAKALPVPPPVAEEDIGNMTMNSTFTSATHPLDRNFSNRAASTDPSLLHGTMTTGADYTMRSIAAPTTVGMDPQQGYYNEAGQATQPQQQPQHSYYTEEGQPVQQQFYDPAYYQQYNQQYGYYQGQPMDQAQWAAHAAYYNQAMYAPSTQHDPNYDPSLYQYSWAPSVAGSNTVMSKASNAGATATETVVSRPTVGTVGTKDTVLEDGLK
ncbi:hypothetical protein BC829DRAFT_440981 [Chytridium lagenaria]|nr:hypothetical protein BC829DRAFT_440981 [Chytridium lagenaria]